MLCLLLSSFVIKIDFANVRVRVKTAHVIPVSIDVVGSLAYFPAMYFIFVCCQISEIQISWVGWSTIGSPDIYSKAVLSRGEDLWDHSYILWSWSMAIDHPEWKRENIIWWSCWQSTAVTSILVKWDGHRSLGEKRGPSPNEVRWSKRSTWWKRWSRHWKLWYYWKRFNLMADFTAVFLYL